MSQQKIIYSIIRRSQIWKLMMPQQSVAESTFGCALSLGEMEYYLPLQYQSQWHYPIMSILMYAN